MCTGNFFLFCNTQRHNFFIYYRFPVFKKKINSNDIFHKIFILIFCGHYAKIFFIYFFVIDKILNYNNVKKI